MTNSKEKNNAKNTTEIIIDEDVQSLTEILSKKQRRIISDERILTSALCEFAENGYSKASLLNIAKNANVSVGLVAQNFGSKELLFECVSKRNYQMLNLPYRGKNGLDWKERFFDIINQYQKSLQNPSFLNELKFVCVSLNGKDIPESFNDFFETQFEKSELFSIMQSAQKKGDIIKGNTTFLYKLVYKNICTIISECKENGVTSPDKEWFITPIIKAKRKNKNKN